MEQEAAGVGDQPAQAHAGGCAVKILLRGRLLQRRMDSLARPTPIYEGRKLRLPGSSKERSRHLLWPRLPAVYQTLQKADRLYGTP